MRAAVALPNGADRYVMAEPFEAERDLERARRAELFPVISLDDIELRSEPPWIIHGLLPARGLGVVYGLPKSRKTFVLADALFHVAMDRTWAGREVRGGAVAYVSAEGRSGFERRMVAFRREKGVEGRGVPFGHVPVAPDLGHNSGDAEILIASLEAWRRSIGGQPIRAIALDTVARTMKGADENTAKDMGTWIANAERIEAAFQCIVIGVHHAGKDSSRGSRGSNALDGAADAMWFVERDGDESTVTIAAMKDGEDGLTWRFRLEPFLFEEERGAPGATGTCTVEIVSDPAHPEADRAASKVMAGVTVDHMQEVRARAGAADPPYRLDQQTPPWIGDMIADVVGLDPTSKEDRRRIKALLNIWLTSGALRIVEDEWKNAQRKFKPVVRPGTFKD